MGFPVGLEDALATTAPRQISRISPEVFFLKSPDESPPRLSEVPDDSEQLLLRRAATRLNYSWQPGYLQVRRGAGGALLYLDM